MTSFTKNLIMKQFFLSALLLATFSVSAQEFRGLDKSPLDMIQYPTSNRETNKSIRVLYSRPQLKGRALSQLAPNGKVWRTGANEASEITFNSSMKLGTTTIPTGSYSLYTIPGEKEWTVILNKATNVWGAYNYDESQDLARIAVPVQEGKESLEAFSMAFESVDGGVHLHMGWDTVRVAVPFTN